MEESRQVFILRWTINHKSKPRVGAELQSKLELVGKCMMSLSPKSHMTVTHQGWLRKATEIRVMEGFFKERFSNIK